MTRDRALGLTFILLGYAAFLIVGIGVERNAPGGFVDLIWAYCDERVLIQHHDPYQESVVLQEYLDEGGGPLAPRDPHQATTFKCVQLPAALLFLFPLGFLKFAAARAIWMIVIAGTYLLAGLLMWDIAAEFAPILSGFLAGLMLANSQVLLILGNASAVVVSLVMIAAWCFFRNRFAMAGVCCLATSMAIKPHVVGFVWLYFLMVGGQYRKRALQTLALTLTISALAVLWIRQVSPDWAHELAANISAYAAHGSLNDPGPGSLSHEILNSVISLQSVFSVFWDYPRIYNLFSYLLCGPLLLIWITVTLRSRPSQLRIWLALATISALCLLPVYHRMYDTKLILLAVPACAILSSNSASKGKIASLVTTAAILLTGDIPLAIFSLFVEKLHLSTQSPSGKMLTILLARPIPLILLSMSVTFLWLYVRASSEEGRQMKLEGSIQDSVASPRA